MIRDQTAAIDDRAVRLDVRLAEVDVATHDALTAEEAPGRDVVRVLAPSLLRVARSAATMAPAASTATAATTCLRRRVTE